MTADGDTNPRRRLRAPADKTEARAVVRQHREAGQPLAGRHADHHDQTRLAAGRGAALEALSREMHGGQPHDYTQRGLAQLPAWFFQLHGKEVPPDAPDLEPPPGFADLLARRAAAAMTGEVAADGDAPGLEPPALPAGPEPATADSTAPDPLVKTEVLPGPAVADGPVRYCRRCGYVKSPVPAPGHVTQCLGGAAPPAPAPDIAWAVEVRDQDGQVVDVFSVVMPATAATLETALDGALTEVRNGQETRS